MTLVCLRQSGRLNYTPTDKRPSKWTYPLHHLRPEHFSRKKLSCSVLHMTTAGSMDKRVDWGDVLCGCPCRPPKLSRGQPTVATRRVVAAALP